LAVIGQTAIARRPGNLWIQTHYRRPRRGRDKHALSEVEHPRILAFRGGRVARSVRVVRAELEREQSTLAGGIA
jgi:hypothetical protein